VRHGLAPKSAEHLGKYHVWKTFIL
jgi:hypothetical protein